MVCSEIRVILFNGLMLADDGWMEISFSFTEKTLRYGNLPLYALGNPLSFIEILTFQKIVTTAHKC